MSDHQQCHALQSRAIEELQAALADRDEWKRAAENHLQANVTLMEECAEIARIESRYWSAVAHPRILELSIGAMGAASNICAAILMGVKPEDYRDYRVSVEARPRNADRLSDPQPGKTDAEVERGKIHDQSIKWEFGPNGLVALVGDSRFAFVDYEYIDEKRRSQGSRVSEASATTKSTT